MGEGGGLQLYFALLETSHLPVFVWATLRVTFNQWHLTRRCLSLNELTLISPCQRRSGSPASVSSGSRHWPQIEWTACISKCCSYLTCITASHPWPSAAGPTGVSAVSTRSCNLSKNLCITPMTLPSGYFMCVLYSSSDFSILVLCGQISLLDITS